MNMAGIGRIILHTSDVEAMVAFYAHYFSFRAKSLEGDDLTELTPVDGGASLLVRRTAHRLPVQASIELVFDVADVEAFVTSAIDRGLDFGPIQHTESYSHCQTQDPDGNRISVSNQAFIGR